jgi:tetratricopeptide (TPR) repeat protein
MTAPESPEIAAFARLAEAPMLGRAAWLAAADLALARAREGHGHAFLLRGEAGIGKSRCARALTERALALGFAVLEARSHEAEGGPALGPWAKMLQRLRKRGDLRKLPRAEAAALTRLLPDPTAPRPSLNDTDRAADDAPHRLFEVVASVLALAAERSPLVVSLDDLHWSDPATVRLARFLARELAGARIVLVFAHRTNEAPAASPLATALEELTRDAETFDLLGLTAGDVGELVAFVAGGAPDSALARSLSARTGGNPFFVKETLRALAAEARLDAALPGDAPLPPTVRSTLQRRLAALSSSAQQMLRLAAVLGSEFSTAVVARAGDAQGLDAEKALDEALRHGIAVLANGSQDKLRFAHDLYRETVLAGTEPREIARVHRAAGDALAALYATNLEAHAAQLARHYVSCGAAEVAREAARFAALAAGAAARSFAFDTAIEQWSTALRALDVLRSHGSEGREELHLRCEALVELGHALWNAGRRRESRENHAQAVALAREIGDATQLARAAIGMVGRNDLPMDFPDESARFLEEALARLPREDSRLRVHLLATLVRARYFGDPPERVEAWAREAVAIAERIGGPSVTFAAYEALHYARLVPDGLEERLFLSNRLAECAREWGSRRAEALAQLWRTVDLLEAADTTGAEASLARFERAAAALRQPYYEWLARGIRGTYALMLGRLEEAERLIFEALKLGQAADTPNALIFFGTQLFHLREEQGRLDELLPLMQRIVAERPALPVFRIGVPVIHAAAGRVDEARAAFEQVAARDFDDVPRDLHRAPMLTTAAVVAAAVGDARRAALLLEELRPLAGRVLLAGVATYWGGSADAVLGMLAETAGDVEEALRCFERAAALARRAGARLHEAHALTLLARALAGRGVSTDAARAAVAQREAEAIYRACGAHWRIAGARSGSGPPAPPGGAPNASTAAPARNAFLRVRNKWLLSFEGVRVELPANKGLSYLHALLTAPEREIHVLELVAEGEAPRASAARIDPALSLRRGEPGFERLDARALAAYRARLRELEAACEEAERNGDAGRLDALARERDALESEIAGALGVNDRARQTGGAIERARKAAYNRIRGAIARIADEHPALGRHLDRSIHTGATCCYRPEQDPGWQLEADGGRAALRR